MDYGVTVGVEVLTGLGLTVFRKRLFGPMFLRAKADVGLRVCYRGSRAGPYNRRANGGIKAAGKVIEVYFRLGGDTGKTSRNLHRSQTPFR